MFMIKYENDHLIKLIKFSVFWNKEIESLDVSLLLERCNTNLR